MKKDDLLKNIAERAYDIGFGAKKHFATYDITEKAPGLISFFSMAFGIFSLVVKGLSTEQASAAFIILGVIGLYISLYDHKKQEYANAGTALTKLFYELKTLYYTVKEEDEDTDLTEHIKKFAEVESRYYPECISKQIIFSNWYAHYKFFWEQQISWIDEQKKFSLFRDKIPLSLMVFLLVSITGTVLWYCKLTQYICPVSIG